MLSEIVWFHVLQPLLSSLVPRPLPFFFVLHSVQYTEVEEWRKTGKPGNTYHVNDIRWTWDECRGVCPSTSTCIINLRVSFLRVKWREQLLRSWLVRAFTWGSLVCYFMYYVHLASTWCHSRDRCSQAFSIFHVLLLCIILNANQRTKTRGGLGTRLLNECFLCSFLLNMYLGLLLQSATW